jgi:hypothetical protein
MRAAVLYIQQPKGTNINPANAYRKGKKTSIPGLSRGPGPVGIGANALMSSIGITNSKLKKK